MRLRASIRTGLGIASLIAITTVWVAIADQHWAAAIVLGALAIACALPAFTGRDPFDARQRRRRHRRHRAHHRPSDRSA